MDFIQNLMKGYSDSVLGPDTSGQGQATADAYQNLLNQLGQGTPNVRAPGDGVGPMMGGQEDANPLQRWEQQINAMITSGDPTLQKQGLAMISDYQSKATTSPSSASLPSAIQEYQYAVNQGYEGSFKDWKEFAKSGTNINVNTGSNRGQYLTPDEKKQGGLDPDASFVWTNDGPKPVAKSAQTEKTEKLNTVKVMTGEMEDMLFGNGGIFDTVDNGTKGLPGYLQRTFKGNIEQYLRDDPRYADYQDYANGIMSNIARTIGGEKGALAEGDVQRVKGLLPQLSGLSPDTKETAAAKFRKLKALMSAAEKKGGLSHDEINSIIGKPQQGSFVSKSGIEFTVE